MKRTKQPEMQVNESTLVARNALANLMGMSFDNQRDLYQTLGYPKEVGYFDFLARYKRQDIAKAIIKRPVQATWAGQIQVSEYGHAKDTAFEKEWDRMEKRLKLKAGFSRLDRLTCLGHYGVLLIGYSDTGNREDFAKPVKKGGSLTVNYIKPIGEGNAQVQAWEDDTKSPRFGMPKTYSINVKGITGANSSQTLLVHYTRALHVSWDLLEDETQGSPVMECVFNRLMDIEKLVGGSAEMYWRGARPGFQGKVDPEYTMGPDTEKKMQDDISEYEHNLRRFFIQEGIELKSLAPQISDPTNHLNIQIQMISAETGIPQRILMGSEQGELASGQDANLWKTTIQDRRTEQIEVHIIRPFVDAMIHYGILPTPQTEDYMIKWSDLFAPSEKERAETGKTRSAAIQSYLQNPMGIEVIPPDVFIEFFLGLTTEQVALVNKMRKEQGLVELDFSSLDEGDDNDDAQAPTQK